MCILFYFACCVSIANTLNQLQVFRGIKRKMNFLGAKADGCPKNNLQSLQMLINKLDTNQILQFQFN